MATSQGDGFVTLVVCLSLLAGLVVGLRFNVRFLAATCVLVLIGGLGFSLAGLVEGGRGALMSAVSILALQVGYFISLLIGAMRLAEEPATLVRETVAEARPDGLRAPNF